ncbi:restriction endonuclease subunit S [Sphingobium sp. LSP13-1-1.1]|uniref:restriction endonuclease subunit S n=1 Tax=Sphingobium sp. LSP13-1-1.1 TaxID=3135234 RepID=UPI00341C4829
MSGELPEGWRTASLGSIIDFVNGYAFKPEDWRDVGTPIIRIQNLNGSDAFNYFAGNIPERYHVRAGDLLFCWSGSRGTSFGARKWSGPLGFLNQHIFRCVVSRDLDFDFAYFLLEGMTGAIEAEAHGGGGLVHIKKSEIVKFEAFLPPLDEQRRIAEVLRSVDETIAQTKVAIEQASRAIEGMLQRLFVEGVGHSDFKDGHSTPVPTSWDEKPLGDLAATPITYGVVQPGPDVADGVPFVRGGDFPNGRIDIGALRNIGKDVASQYRRTQLRGGEIVVSLVGYPGACAIVPDVLAGANIARQAALIRPSAEILASYLYQFLRSPIGQDRLKKETIGSAQQVINLRDLKEVIVAVPPKREQDQIAAILADLDAFVELETANLDKLTALKGSIAADLLSGHVRVPA